MRFIILLALIAVVAGCAQSVRPHTANQERPSITAPGNGPVMRDKDGMPFPPIHFFDALKRLTNNCIMVFGERRTWIVAADIKPLMGRIDSQKPCAGVVSSYSSHIPPSDFRSTEGREAAFLIEGFRKGFYPPGISSDLFEPDTAELKEWYHTWNKKGQVPK